MKQRCAIALAAVVAVPGLALAGATKAGLRWNNTDSMPVGLWRIEHAGELHRGDIVTACLPAGLVSGLALRRGYVDPGNCPSGTMPLIKPIVASAGDTVRVTAEGISVNGAEVPNSKALSRDAAGRPMDAVPAGTYPVQPDSVWLLSGHLADYDSRYFGALPVAAVQGTARPVWVIR